MKRLKIICFSTPFVVYILSLLLAYLFYGTEPQMWYENDVEEGEAFRFGDLPLIYAIASVLLTTCLLNLYKKVRESGFLSFLTFFWPYCLILIYAVITTMNPLMSVWLIAMLGGLPYVAILIIYFIIFRIIS